MCLFLKFGPGRIQFPTSQKSMDIVTHFFSYQGSCLREGDQNLENSQVCHTKKLGLCKEKGRQIVQKLRFDGSSVTDVVCASLLFQACNDRSTFSLMLRLFASLRESHAAT